MASGEPASDQKLSGEKATRIVSAMRTCVARYGAAGATFDHVSKEAGVSRGLLHYYFGSKQNLLIEVIRSETERLVGVIHLATAVADSAEELVDLLLAQLRIILAEEPEIYLLGFELVGEAQRHPEIANEVAEFNRRTRGGFAEIIAEMTTKGAISPRHSPAATAGALLALANGLAHEILQDPEGDHEACTAAVIDAARHLLGAQNS
jgi:AcrR family transcriptional regulator